MSADARADPRFVESESVIAENIMSILCVPLVIRDRIAGAIYVDHREAEAPLLAEGLRPSSRPSPIRPRSPSRTRGCTRSWRKRGRGCRSRTNRSAAKCWWRSTSTLSSAAPRPWPRSSSRSARLPAGHSTVLLRGESGTGKGLIARIIHNVSPRRNGPFIMFNCAALPRDAGRIGAVRPREGRVHRRRSPQAGTLRAGQRRHDLPRRDRQDEPGHAGQAAARGRGQGVRARRRHADDQDGRQDHRRHEPATSRRPSSSGTFREDLYYRLNIIPLMLPPLRERKDDIPLLAEHFIQQDLQGPRRGDEAP